MKKIWIICILLLSFTINIYARSIAIEFREANGFSGVIGSVYLTEDSFEMVGFTELNGRVTTNAFIFKFIEKKYQEGDVLNIKCANQLGVIFTGFINLKDKLKPQINLVSGNGILMTNISEQGLKFKERFIPKVTLGE